MAPFFTNARHGRLQSPAAGCRYKQEMCRATSFATMLKLLSNLKKPCSGGSITIPFEANVRIKLITFLVAGCLLLLAGCVGRGVEVRAKKPPPVITLAGTQIPALAIAFDISYDPKTDGVVPDYSIVNVSITNNSLQVVPLDPMADKWWIVDRKGKRHAGIISLRRTDPDRWASLPVGLKKLLEYPLMVPIGSTQSIDLLTPAKVNLNELREVVFRSVGLDKEIRVYARE